MNLFHYWLNITVHLHTPVSQRWKYKVRRVMACNTSKRSSRKVQRNSANPKGHTVLSLYNTSSPLAPKSKQTKLTVNRHLNLFIVMFAFPKSIAFACICAHCVIPVSLLIMGYYIHFILCTLLPLETSVILFLFSQLRIEFDTTLICLQTFPNAGSSYGWFA